MRLIIFGPPGAGKGTQAQFLSTHFSIPHISTGEIFRAAMLGNTPIGIEAKKYLDAGNLVPDEVTNDIIREALASDGCTRGFLLDGFPRTLPQAEALDDILRGLSVSLDAVINLIVPGNEIIDRMMKRGRADDSRETIENRMRVYLQNTEPLICFYREKGVLRDVQGMGDIIEITKRILDSLNHR